MIKQLNQDAIIKISTSATLQSLSSFLKEIVENSIDAESTQISIIFYNQGKNGFEVSDDGNGISMENQKLLATRGGTSKISNYEDLQAVLTHGFRGEALNAIAALSNLTIISKHKDDIIGWKWEIPSSPTKIAKDRGTSIKVENIFYSLPVRALEFSKNYKSEYNKAVNLLTEYAIINTNIEFKVYNELEKLKKQIILDSGNITEKYILRIQNILGDQVVSDLIEFQNVQQGFTLKGYLSKSIESGSYKGQTRKTQWYCYINKKPINAPKLLLSIMRDIYRQHNPNGNFFFILEIILDNISDADFNVSVDKRDVYLKNEKTILECLKQTVNEQLEKNKGHIKYIGKDGTLDQFVLAQSQESQKNSQTKQRHSEVPEKRRESAPVETKVIEKRNSSFLNGLKSLNPSQKLTVLTQNQERASKITFNVIDQQFQTQFQQLPNIQDQISNHQKNQSQGLEMQKTIEQEQFEEPAQYLKQCHFTKEYFNQMEIIGQFNKGFIICEHNENIYVLDQHACDEKHNFERLIKELQFQKVQLLAPISVTLSGYEIDLVKENVKVLLDKFKYTIEVFDTFVQLKTCPSYNNKTFGQDAFKKIIHQLSEGKTIDEIEISEVKAILASQACRGSIMIGTDLQPKEMNMVVKNLSKMQSPWNCPHGRPTLVQIEQPKLLQYSKGFSEILLN